MAPRRAERAPRSAPRGCHVACARVLPPLPRRADHKHNHTRPSARSRSLRRRILASQPLCFDKEETRSYDLQIGEGRGCSYDTLLSSAFACWCRPTCCSASAQRCTCWRSSAVPSARASGRTNTCARKEQCRKQHVKHTHEARREVSGCRRLSRLIFRHFVPSLATSLVD